jgi:CYTH domain-containing protein/CHAD domain-containing protein
MGYALRPDRRLQREVRRVANERFGGAIEQLDAAIDDTPDPADLEVIVHDVRKRCKASRGLARLIKPALGDGFRTFDRMVRDAANELSALRDAHAVLGTLDTLLATRPDDHVLQEVRSRQAAVSVGASHDVGSDLDVRLATARAKLIEAQTMSQRWKLPRGFDTLEAGITATYRQGSSALRRVRSDPTDRRLHEWRKAVKYLWYQMQLVHDAAPSVLSSLVDELDRLAEALGDDHDLTVLVELLEAGSGNIHSPSEVGHVCELARQRQAMLRDFAVRSGATIYAERHRAFADRIGRYWQLGVDFGPECSLDASEPAVEPPTRPLIERERKWIIDTPPQPALAGGGVEFRQGYLASDERRSIRVRDAGEQGCTLTFKAGSGAERTELEWPIERREFEAAWPFTAGRRITKTRHRIPTGEHVIELDVFGGSLEGLILAEVEFGSVEELAAFQPPDWFGRDVTDDGRYTNAALALSGLPAEAD